jgi:hypothetical protein
MRVAVLYVSPVDDVGEAGPEEIVDLNNRLKLAECDVADEERRQETRQLGVRPARRRGRGHQATVAPWRGSAANVGTFRGKSDNEVAAAQLSGHPPDRSDRDAVLHRECALSRQLTARPEVVGLDPGFKMVGKA